MAHNTDSHILDAIKQLSDKIAGIETRLDARFNTIDARLNNIDIRLSSIDSRIATIDGRLTNLEILVRKIERCLDSPIENLDLADNLPPRPNTRKKTQAA